MRVSAESMLLKKQKETKVSTLDSLRTYQLCIKEQGHGAEDRKFKSFYRHFIHLRKDVVWASGKELACARCEH